MTMTFSSWHRKQNPTGATWNFKTENMAAATVIRLIRLKLFTFLIILLSITEKSSQDILGCGGFLKSQVPIDFSKVDVKLYTKQGTLKESSDCAPNNGYYFIPLYDKGEYLLKIEPPVGWYFDPKEVHLNFDGVNDPCSKSNDINFAFKGFAIYGKVTSKGQNEGPEGVTVNLISETDKNRVESTVTGKNGYFQFTPILPDNYVIKVQHDRFKFVKESVKFTVKEGNLKVPDGSLIVGGYDIIGQVLFNGEPIKGVSFVLLGKEKIDVPGCSKAPLPNFKHKDYICHVNSNEKGIFHIQTVPSGSYKIKPHYVKFDVQPEEMNVVVNHGHVRLAENFLVKGFSVSGRVLTGPNGSGIKNAEIFLNGQKVTTTDDDGRYNLDSMEPGNYVLSVKLENVRFADINVRMSPNTPEIENIYPSEFKVCGTVIPSTGQQQSRYIEIKSASQPNLIIEVAALRETGAFCQFLKVGTYTLNVKISDFEKSKGLQYLPVSREIKVTNQPIYNIEFSQLKGTISGKIIKLAKDEKAVELVIKMKSKNTLIAVKTLEGDETFYSFSDVMPGNYDIEIHSNHWCFDKQAHSVSVTSSDTSVPNFVQNGYKTKILSSHSTNVKVKGPRDWRKEISLEKGENVLCLPQAATFYLEPFGCHGYEKDEFSHNVGTDPPLKLNAISHDVSGSVVCTDLVNDLHVDISHSSGQVKRIGPLKGIKEASGGVKYEFTYRTKENQFLKFTPSSENLLFQPEVVEYRTINDCSKNVIQFTGEKGLIVEGSVNPPLSNVKIILKILGSESEANELNMVTKADGKYKFGPLKSSAKYEITAEKESYVLTGPDKKNIFKAHKLAEINVKVLDNATKEPLQGVLLSLTGGEKYRKNSVTQEGGLLSFHSLSPGEYFLRPMMKEYKFEPSSQIIQVKEGATENIELKGRRVSFSVYGTITSLNGEPEPNVVIEAVGINACSNLQEEAASETNGNFRIRGLLPQCEYNIRLKQGAEINKHIHRIAPEDTVVKTSEGDVKDIHLIAFQLIEHTDVTVLVDSTIPEHLKTLKLKLCKDDSPDSPIYSVKLDSLAGGAKHWGNAATQERFLKAGLLVQLPFIPRDKTPYFIQIESTLNKHTFNYKEPVVHFIADKTYRNFKLLFEPVPKVLDHEFSQSNLIIIPLLLAAGLIYTYSQKIAKGGFNYPRPFFSFSNNQERNSHSYGGNNGGNNDNISIEPVNPKRKAKPRKT